MSIKYNNLISTIRFSKGISELQQPVQHFSFESKLSRNRLYRKLVRHNANPFKTSKRLPSPWFILFTTVKQYKNDKFG
uniref:Uncharacterized protein n=1 Tax=Solanum tuberosum TaxID=4113 RepID=M1B674_SOLTU